MTTPESFTHAIGFDPVFGAQDGAQFLHDSVPDHLLENADLRGLVLRMTGGPIRHFMARRWLGGRGIREIAQALHEQVPDDVRGWPGSRRPGTSTSTPCSRPATSSAART
jgi:hypothetical protein